MKLSMNRYKAVCISVAMVILSGMTGYAHKSTFFKPVINEIKNCINSETPLNDKLNVGIKGVNKIINDQIGFKSCYFDIYSLTQKVCGTKEFERDNVILLNNGYLAYKRNSVSTEKIENRVESLNKLYNYCKNKNIYFKYYITPDKLSKYDNELPNDLEDHINPAVDKFYSLTNAEKIPCEDLRESVHKEFGDDYSAFFITDHHWKPQTGFWAFKNIYKELSKELRVKYNKSITDSNNYSTETKKEIFLGSQGKITGRFVAGVDDIDIITPNFSTSFTVSQPFKDFTATGNYKDVLMRMDFAESTDMYNSSQYAAYLGGDFTYEIIKNNMSENDKKIMIIKDSYANCVIPFLSMGFDEIHAFDLREITGYKIDSVYKYIDSIKPDALIFLYSPLRLSSDESFKFENE
ncbi:MAG: hypothetical protein K6F76_08220 [Clostridiales bacterium]|nr:hypothetical protein [Clostridiales bacterium]